MSPLGKWVGQLPARLIEGLMVEAAAKFFVITLPTGSVVGLMTAPEHWVTWMTLLGAALVAATGLIIKGNHDRADKRKNVHDGLERLQCMEIERQGRTIVTIQTGRDSDEGHNISIYLDDSDEVTLKLTGTDGRAQQASRNPARSGQSTARSRRSASRRR